MKTKISKIITVFFSALFVFSGCSKDGMPGPAGRNGENASVYYSEWFTPSAWSGSSGDWYFNTSAPDLTQNIVENGVVLAYVWLANDLYEATSVRPLPAYAVGANWSYLIHQYENIEFTSDMIEQPLTSSKFRFIAIPGTSTALKSAGKNDRTINELKKMSYKDICKMYNIPE
jgi:hypothetical protein